MNPFENAIATLRTRQLAQKEEETALTLVMAEALRMRKALMFYAAARNYIDGVPMLTDGETQLLDTPDDGFTARRALKLDDYAGEVLALPVVERKELGGAN